jgi:putative membrane protein
MAIREMEQHSRAGPAAEAPLLTGVALGAVVLLGGALLWLSTHRPTLMPVWGPWDFSPSIYLATALTLLCFCRGLALMAPEARPAVWRRVAFLAGLAVTYAVLQTRFEYWSQHMFFLNRIQHVVMHHLGPFLIALGWPGAAIDRGLPPWARRAIRNRWIVGAIRVLQQPAVALVLFVGSFFFWLIPGIHFRAMLDDRLYALMNWTMVLDGILFWVLVLDPRPKPPARVSYGVRAALAIGVMFPQILLGSLITFAPHDLYPYYDLCGRLFPNMGPLYDQHIGGIIIWIPPAMMSVMAMILVLNALRLHEQSKKETDEDASSLAALSRRWTGL